MPRAQRDRAADRDAKVWELRQRCWSQQRIADELKVTQACVSKVLKRVQERALADLRDSVERVKAEQTCQLQHIATEALEAWERSKRTAKRVTKKKGAEETVTTEIRERDGDARFLAEAARALSEVRAIWGLDAPKRIEASHELSARDALAEAEAVDAAFEQRAIDPPETQGE